MSFREWLPITRRNRVALGLAFLALVMFVTWNCLPYYRSSNAVEPWGITAMSIWPEVISPQHIVRLVKSPDSDAFLGIAICMSLIVNAFITLAAVPFWKLLHASSYIRLPLAIISLLGGGVLVHRYFVLRFVFKSEFYVHQPPWLATLLLIALSMLALATALFVFKNELALRSERLISQTRDL